MITKIISSTQLSTLFFTDEIKPITMNRCGKHILKFDSSVWKGGDPTPGKGNDCNKKKFSMRKNLLQHVLIKPTSTVVEPCDSTNDLMEVNDCISGNQLNSEKLEQTIYNTRKRNKNEDVCPPLDENPGDRAATTIALKVGNNKKRKIQACSIESNCPITDPDNPNHPDRQDNFNLALSTINQHEKRVDISNVIEAGLWIQYIKNELNHEEDAINCYYCSKYAKLFGVGLNLAIPNQLAGAEGMKLHINIGDNNKELKKHPTLQSHNTVMTILDQKKVMENSADVEELIQQEGIQYHLITIRHMKTAFSSVKHYFSLKSHTGLVELQESNGVDMGRSCRTGYHAGRMIQAISNMYKKELLEIIKSTTKPVSIILDGSSDKSKDHYMSILFQYYGK